MKTFTQILSQKIINTKQVHKAMRDLRRETKRALAESGCNIEDPIYEKLREVMK